MKNLRSLLLLLFISLSFAQVEPKINENWLDFWVGKWKLEWKDKDGSRGKGSNEIKKILANKVIYEKFEAKKGALKGFKGRSFSVIDATTGNWKQTWVDNQNGYLDFVGSQNGDKKIFSRKFKNKKGNPVIQRMVFKDIKENSFTWDWEISQDEGKTWDLKWQIFYTKKVKNKLSKQK